MGILKLKMFVVFIITFAETLADVLKDKKVTLPEGFKLAFGLKPLPATIKDFPAIVAEIRDLDPAERADLIELVKTELDLENDNLENNIELITEFAINLSDLIDLFGKKKDG